MESKVINPKTKATNEQQIFYAEKIRESNERYNRQNTLQKKINKMKNDIAIATIGYGKAITIMSDTIEELGQQLENLRQNPINTHGDFKEKFGVSPDKIDFN